MSDDWNDNWTPQLTQEDLARMEAELKAEVGEREFAVMNSIVCNHAEIIRRIKNVDDDYVRSQLRKSYCFGIPAVVLLAIAIGLFSYGVYTEEDHIVWQTYAAFPVLIVAYFLNEKALRIATELKRLMGIK
jgi:hypothetical protein